MSEIKVGEYIRFEVRILNIVCIAKVLSIETFKFNENLCKTYYKTDNGEIAEKSEILKHSPNIIDLIEVDDFVDSMQVASIWEDNGERYLGLANDNVTTKVYYSVVTKEQFAESEYKVNE